MSFIHTVFLIKPLAHISSCYSVASDLIKAYSLRDEVWMAALPHKLPSFCVTLCASLSFLLAPGVTSKGSRLSLRAASAVGNLP